MYTFDYKVHSGRKNHRIKLPNLNPTSNGVYSSERHRDRDRQVKDIETKTDRLKTYGKRQTGLRYRDSERQAEDIETETGRLKQ